MRRPAWSPDLSRLREMAWEAAAVLAAILIAFALDAWWDGHVERTAMLDALDAVAVEMEQNLELLDSAIALNERQMQTAREFVSQGAADVAALPESEVYRFWGFPNHEILTLEAGAITAFIEGGFLQAVGDDALRTEIASVATLQEELNEEREGFRAFDERFTEMVFRITPIVGLADDSGVEELREVLRVLATSEEARRSIYGRAFLLGIYTEEMRRLREVLAGSRTVIEEAVR
jgi:hypothetical protein